MAVRQYVSRFLLKQNNAPVIKQQERFAILPQPYLKKLKTLAETMNSATRSITLPTKRTKQTTLTPLSDVGRIEIISGAPPFFVKHRKDRSHPSGPKVMNTIPRRCSMMSARSHKA